jgi:hypothetical protein
MLSPNATKRVTPIPFGGLMLIRGAGGADVCGWLPRMI